MLVFFFMLRASEYLLTDKNWSEERVLHGDNVAPRRANEELASFRSVEEVVINIFIIWIIFAIVIDILC